MYNYDTMSLLEYIYIENKTEREGILMEKKEKKKFKIPIRKELITSVLMMVIMFAIMFAFMPLVGMNNAMIVGMSIMPILLVTKNDYTLHFKKNSLFFFIIQMSLVALAYAASLNLATKIPVSFAVFFLIIYIFTYDDKMSIYMPFLLNFIMMLYFPVYGVDLGIRFAIVAIATIIMLGLQLLVHRNKFKKNIKKQMEELIPMMEKQVHSIENKEDKQVILEQNKQTAAKLTALQGALDAKMSHFVQKWDEGNNYLKGVLLFKRINRFVRETYCSSEHNQESFSPDMLTSLTNLIHTIVQYGEKQVEQQAVEAAIYECSKQMHSTALTYELETDIQLFEKKHIDDAEQIKPAASFWDTLKSRMNINNVIYALKVSLICAAGMLVTELLNLPKAYLFPLSVVVVTQPYTKLTRKAAGSRMLNTLYMVVIYLLAFSFTDIIWLNILILVVTIIVGDIFLKFYFNVVITGIVAVAMGSMASSTTLTGTEYAFVRLAYVCAACILIVLIDAMFFPRHVNESVKKQLNKSVALNQTILSCISNPNTTAEELLQALRQKRAINRKIKFNQQYIKSDEMAQYLLSDQEWTERVYFLYDSLAAQKLTMQQVNYAYHVLHDNTKGLSEVVHAEQDRTQISIILNLYDLLKGIQESELIVETQISQSMNA